MRWVWGYLFSSFCWSITYTQRSVLVYGWMNINTVNTKILEASDPETEGHTSEAPKIPFQSQSWTVKESSLGESDIRRETQIKEGNKWAVWVWGKPYSHRRSSNVEKEWTRGLKEYQESHCVWVKANGCMDGRMHAWMDAWMDGWVEGRTDAWTNEVRNRRWHQKRSKDQIRQHFERRS